MEKEDGEKEEEDDDDFKNFARYFQFSLFMFHTHT